MSTEFEKQLYPPGIAMSPAFSFARFDGMAEKYGLEVVQTDGRFKMAREMWATAAFLLALARGTAKQYWLAPEHEGQTPDTFGFSIAPHATVVNGNVQEKMSIEVTEWEEHAEGGLAETILRVQVR